MATDQRLFSFGSFELVPATQELRREGNPVPLKPKVFDLLLVLVENRSRLLEKDELMSLLWPDLIVEESNLSQSVYELRKALGDSAREPRFIENVPRRGYRFIAPVQETTAALSPTEGPSRIRCIAVLPFAADQTTADDPPLRVGIAEALQSGLSRVPALTVRSAASLFDHPDLERDDLAAGTRLGVNAVVRGTAQAVGDRLRLTAQLVQVNDGTILWADTFDGSTADIFTLQDAICERVVRALAVTLPDGADRSLTRRHTDDPEVHRLFLTCRYHWHRWTPANWRRSIEWGQRAVQRDPGHAPSYAWMAASWCALGLSGSVPPREAFGRARELVATALRLDPELPEGHEVHGAVALFHDWMWDTAERALRRAVALNPSGGGAHDLLALLAIVAGRPEEAIRQIRKALAVEPLSLIVNTDVGNVLYYARRFTDAAEQLRRTLELDRFFAHARFGLARALLQLGHTADAVSEVRKALHAAGRNPATSPELGHILARSGDPEGAQRILESLAARSRLEHVDPYGVALVHVGLDNRAAACEALERAFIDRSRELIYLRAEPAFGHLHDDPAFDDLMNRVGV